MLSIQDDSVLVLTPLTLTQKMHFTNQTNCRINSSQRQLTNFQQQNDKPCRVLENPNPQL